MVRGLVIAVVVLAAGSVRASPVRIETTGAACDLAELEARVAALAGPDGVRADAVAVVQISTARDGGDVTAEVSFDDGAGRHRGPRVVRAAGCDELVAATAVVIAMGLPELMEATTEPAASRPLSHELEAAETITEIHLAAPPRPARDDAGLDVVVGIDSSGAAIAGTRWRRGRGSITTELHLDIPEDRQVAVAGQIRILRAEIAVAPCRQLGAFGACAIATLGVIHGTGEGLDAARGATTPVLAGGLRATWEHAVTARFVLQIHVDASAFATRTQFDVDHMSVWTSGRVEASAGIGILAHFP